jgi:putative hydrolase of the HAD superfamily
LEEIGEAMTTSRPITALFLDIGGVLLTNGWDRHARMRAAERFHLDYGEMDERHHLTFDTYEAGKLSLDEYLQRVIFYEERSFTKEEFRTFMFSRSQPYNEMIDFIRVLKARHHLKTVAVSNEGRELTRYRIQQFNLQEVIDFFVSSCFVHLRKPDAEIYHIALDIAQSPPEQVVYIDDRLMFVQVANGMGIQGVHHTGYQATHEALADLGLEVA